MRRLLIVLCLFVLAACATRNAVPPVHVTVTSPQDLGVRRYPLVRVPALLESMLRERMSDGESAIELEIKLRNTTFTTTRPAFESDSLDPRATIDWFAIDYIVRNRTTGKLTTGQVLAHGPEPASYGSIEVDERAVVASAVARLEDEVARVLRSSPSAASTHSQSPTPN